MLSPDRPTRVGVFAGSALIAACALAALTGCVAEQNGRPSASASAESATPDDDGSTEPRADDPELIEGGTAQDNLPYFARVIADRAAEGGDLGGRDFIDALVAAGFPKADMEVTPDRTTVDLAADSIQFSVRYGGACLIGQYGSDTTTAVTAPILSTGRCLVGQTRVIDW